jgi:hypothetical protein
MVEPEPAPFAPDMRRQQPGAPAERDQFAAQILGGAVRRQPRIALIGDNLVANQPLDALFERGKIGGQSKFHDRLRQQAQPPHGIVGWPADRRQAAALLLLPQFTY